ncbi:MAG: hypothetical protein Q4D81_14975, partial [Eubacteriales bacterium]|nr:hypothetical protein [Eubacteriales bacterium]
MGKILMIKTAVFFILAVGILMLPVFWMRWKKIKNLNLAVTAYVLVLVWLTRLAIGLFAYGASALKISDLSFPEKVFDSMVHALQTFSMDENYASYLKVGKEAIKRAGYPAWASVYGIIVSFLNVCAPVLGGALLLEILAGVFPYIRVRASLFRHVLIFSELNDASITLAEDICQKKNYTSFLKISSGSIPPLLVFTDAYPDRSSEPRSELFERAAAIGAVCIKTDLLHIPLRLAKTVSYFLMDQKADENVSTAATLLQKDEKGSYLWPSPSRRLLDLSAVGKEPPARIYIFTRDDAEDEMIQQAHNNMEKEKGNVFVRPIRDHMNTAIYRELPAKLTLNQPQSYSSV